MTVITLKIHRCLVDAFCRQMSVTDMSARALFLKASAMFPSISVLTHADGDLK